MATEQLQLQGSMDDTVGEELVPCCAVARESRHGPLSSASSLPLTLSRPPRRWSYSTADDQVAWARVGQFHADKMGYHDRMTLLRSQGAAEVVMWDPLKQLVLAVDVDSRVTCSIGPLSGRTYYSDFIPYVNSYAEIYRWRSGQAWRRTRPSRLLRRRRTCGRRPTSTGP